MTPSKKGNTTIIRIEKVKKTLLDESQVAHKAGGQHSGLVINKQAVSGKDHHNSININVFFISSFITCIWFIGRIPNTEVLERCRIHGIEAMIKRAQLRWMGHVRRMADSRLPT